MSYAEHGSRIFLTGKFNPNPLLRYGDYVVARKRSEGRLKLFESCSDLRAWSPNRLDNVRHFRDVIENRPPSGRIVPYEVLIENVIQLGQTELIAVRRQLKKYKSLRLTPEQKKQLQEFDFSSDDNAETSQCVSHREPRLVEDDSGIPKRPGTPTQSICSSSTYFHDIEIDGESTSDNSERSQEVFISSGSFVDVDQSNEGPRQVERTPRHHRAYGNSSNKEIIIKKDSEIIALKHELAAKIDGLEEMKEICRNLQSSLNEKERMLGNLRSNLNTSQEQLLNIEERIQGEKEEWKQRLYDAECLIDHLRSSLAEKSEKCSGHTQEIQILRERVQEFEILRKERDCLIKKLDEMKIVLCENEMRAITVDDQEDEINRLLGYIKRTREEHDEEKMRLKCELRYLRNELEQKISTISQFETHQVTVRTEIGPSGSLSEVETSEIQKIKKALEEDLQAVVEELSRRRKCCKNDCCQKEEMGSGSKRTRDRGQEKKESENPEREKDFVECTIEQLTVQVSPSNVANVEQDAIDEEIFENFKDSKETLRRLVFQLEPYISERATLIDEIKLLNEALEKEKQDSQARVANNCGKYCGECTEKIAVFENLLEKRNRPEHDNEMDGEIDKVLAIHVKSSIEKLNKLSAGLRGAGDEMAKIRDEVEVREAEIAKLREQVNSHVSRGQGDEANNEYLKEIVRLKSEKKRLLDELKSQSELLKKTKDELQSREFELKGSKHQRNIAAQYKREIQSKNKQIEGLAKEMESLRKTVLVIDELASESDTIKIKLQSLQEENTNLMDENTKMTNSCVDYKNRIIAAEEKELRARECFERVEFELQKKAAKNELAIESLKRENKTLVEESNMNKLKITKLTKELEDLKENKKDTSEIENVWAEMSKFNEDRQRLDDKVDRLRQHLEYHYRTNDKLEDCLKKQIGENEILRNAIEKLKDDIATTPMDKMAEESAKKMLYTLPNKICEHIERMKKQLNTPKVEAISWQSEMNEMRAKSLEDDTIIERLRDEITVWKNKVSQQNKMIVALEKANADLQEKLGNLERKEKSFENKLQPDMVNEMKTKETEIAKLARDVGLKNEELKSLNESVQALTKEKNEIAKKLKKEEELRVKGLAEIQQKHAAKMKDFNDMHNDSIKKLMQQDKEFRENTENPFDPDSWLRSLTLKEMAELHKKICISSPCELIGEASKTRALNDKQNQQLQHEEKLQSDMFNMKNGHHKDSAIGFPYAYERRKFESTSNKPVQSSYNDNTFDTQRMNFFNQCAIKHKYDSSH